MYSLYTSETRFDTSKLAVTVTDTHTATIAREDTLRLVTRPSMNPTIYIYNHTGRSPTEKVQLHLMAGDGNKL